METYSHAFFTWALAKHGVEAGRAAGVAAATGAVFPDLPSYVGTAYHVGMSFVWEGWEAMHSEALLDAIYFTGPFGATGSALHSVIPVVLLLIVYRVLGLGRRDTRRILLWFLLGWFGHTVADFLTHVDDTRPFFWPIADWEWSSPVSYYNPLYYGEEFFAISHGLMLLIILWLCAKRVVGWGRGSREPADKG